MNRDGTLLEQTPCPSYPRSYERWLRGTERGYEAEVEDARRLGIAMQPVDALVPHLLTREEFGGAEIHDVLNLIPLAKSLGYVDMDNVFILGVSRGGMETYLALKNGIPVRRQPW